jgi:hypothetical protein
LNDLGNNQIYFPMKYESDLELWCVQCRPVHKKDDAKTKRDISLLLAGPGKAIAENDLRAVTWTALAMEGIRDRSKPHYATQNQRLIIFRTKRAADIYAKKEAAKNDQWTFKAQPVRLNAPDDTDLEEYEEEVNHAGTWWREKFSDEYDSIMGMVMTPSEGKNSAREEVVGVAATKPTNEAERIVDAHNNEIKRLIAKFTLSSHLG